MIDARAKQFLEQAGTGPITQVEGGLTRAARESDTMAAYRQQEFIERVGAIHDELAGFFVQQRKKYDRTDDEWVAAIALFTINVRHSYGEAQAHNPEEIASWTDAQRAAKLAEFDTICEAMQVYHDENKDKP